MKRQFTNLFLCLFTFFGACSTLIAQVSVTATGGTLTGTYTTVSAAFAAINAGTHQGAITISLTGNTTEPAAPTALLRSTAPSSYTSVLIIPSGGNRVINSAALPTANRGIIELSGADNVTIDGDDPATAGARNLTIQAATSTNTGVTCVRLSSNSTVGADGADNNTVKNCIIIGARASATATNVNYGINMSNYSTTSMTTGAYSSVNTTIQNNEIRRCYVGIFANGASSLYTNTGLKILANILGSATAADNIGQRGIVVTNTSTTPGINSALIEGNDLRVGDVSVTGAGYFANITGIELGTVNSGIQVLRNNIHDILQPNSGGYGAYGINITGAANCDNFVIANNFINNIVTSKYTITSLSSFTAYGIRVNAGATFMKVFHNTIVMNAAQTGTTANYTNYGFATTVTTPSISDFKNNIIINNNVGTGTYGVYINTTSSALTGAFNNNNYFVNSGNVGYYNGANQTTLAAWKTAINQDANALNTPVAFVSASDLHIDITNPGCMLLDGAGATGTNVAVDIDLQSRPTNPDLGADEFTLPACSGTPTFLATAISPTTAVCNSGNFTMSGALAVPASGYTYQWQSSSSPTGPFTNVTGAIGPIYNANAVNGTTYYQVVATCSVSGSSGTSSVVTASINPNPTIVLTPSNNGYFCGSGIQSITATGADTYTWSPAGTLDVTSGPVVNSTTSSSITYSVVGTNTTTGCFSNQTITVGPPSITIASSTPNFCGTGGNVNLTATSAVDPNMAYSWTNLTPSATLSSTSGSAVSATITETSNFQVNGTGSGAFTGCNSVQFVSIGVYPLPTASLTATPDQICPGGSTTINTGLSAGNFSVIGIPYVAKTAPGSAVTVATNGVASVPLSGGSLDDGGWSNIPIGFNFNFFGTNFSTISAGTNGLLMFGPVPGYGTASGQLGQYLFNTNPTACTVPGPNGTVFPNCNNPGNVIALMAADQYFGSGTAGSASSTMKYWTEGYAPNRVFIIEYSDVDACCGNLATGFTAQARLYETLGIVDIAVANKSNTNAATIGLQDVSKTIGAVAPGRQNFTTTIVTPETWRFIPPANYNTTWTATNTQGSSTIASGTNIFTQTLTPSESTNYSISYTNQTTGCTNTPGSAQVQMTVLPTTPPVGLNSIASASLVCVNANINLSTSYTGSTTGLTFQWQSSTDGGTTWNNIATANTPSTTVTQTVTTQYRCEIVSCGGTPGYSAPTTVNLQNPPAIAASASAANFCAPGGTPVLLTVTGTGVTYDWLPTAGLSATTGTSVSATPTSSTTYTITATDAIGCSNTTTISVNSSPQLIFSSSTATPSTICSGNNVNLSASAISGQPPAGYCVPSYANGTSFGDFIGLVQLGNINNPTAGAAAPYYTLFPASGVTTTTLTAGSTYTITLQAGSYTANDLAAFIDYNQNVVLDDLGEKLGETNDLGAAPAQTSFVFTVPATAINGPTILRVRELDGTGTPIDPCTNLSSYGEAEDYVVTITGGVDPQMTYSWSPATYLSSTTTSSTTATAMINSTSYVVTAASVSGCQVTDTINVTVNPSPSTPVVSGDTICSGNVVSLNSSTGTGTIGWYLTSSGGAPIATGSNFTSSALTSSTTYYVQDSTAAGCVSQRIPVGVTVNPTPIVSLGNDITQCGGAATLDAGNSGATYLWNNSQTTQTVSVTSSGSFNVLVTNQFNCSASDSVNVTINSIPLVNLGPNASYCANSFVLDAQNSGSTYLWNNGSTNQSITVSASGSYDVTVTSPQGCVGVDTISLTLASSPIVNLGVDTTLCGGGSVILDAQNAGSSFVWNDNTTASILFVSTSGTYWVDVTNSSNCTTRDSITVNIVASPTIALTGGSTLCFGDSATLSASGASSYVWSPANINGSSVNVSPTSSTTYTVTGTDVNGCTDNDTISLTVNPLPVLTALINDSAVCAGSTVSLSASGAQNYQWSPIASSGSNVNDTPTSSVTYTVIGTDANGCTSQSLLSVVVSPNPVVSLGSNIAACSGPILLDAANSGSTYLWNDNSTGQTLSVNNTGSYSVQVTDLNGCSGFDSITVTINSNPSVNLGNDTTVCSGSLSLDAANSGATYLWNDGSTNQTLPVSIGGQYFVTITYSGGCSASDTINIGINTLPLVNLSLTTSSVCANGSVVALAGESPAGGTFSGAGVSGSSFDPNGAVGNVAVIVYSFTDQNGCTGTTSDSISLIAPPSVSLVLGVDSACSADPVVNLSGESPIGGTFSGTSVTGNNFDPSVGFGTYLITYTFTDTVTGCSNNASQNFIVDVCAGNITSSLANVKVYPNPNNGQFFIETSGYNEKIVAEVFNAQGKLVHAEQFNSNYRNTVNLGEFSNGVYLLRLNQGSEFKFFKLTLSK
ncbi:MAG: beta strand repeat-containing protein [Bacteroidota bacterium]